MNVFSMISPKCVFNRFVDGFGFRRTVVATTLGATCAFAGFTLGLLIGPDDPKPIETKPIAETAKTVVETVTENIVEKENV